MSNFAGAARSGIDLQRDIDSGRYSPQASLQARMRAVVIAQQRLVQREDDAEFELRQSLIDLAAVAELIADGLPAPTRHNS